MQLFQNVFENSGVWLKNSDARRISDCRKKSIKLRFFEDAIEIAVEIRYDAHLETAFEWADDFAAVRETRRRFADERLGDRLDESMASRCPANVEDRPNWRR